METILEKYSNKTANEHLNVIEVSSIIYAVRVLASVDSVYNNSVSIPYRLYI